MACLYVGRNRPGSAWHMSRHGHAWHELVLIVRGAERVAAGETLVAHAGDAVLFPAGQPHEEWAEGELESWFWAFTGELPAGLPQRVADLDGRLRQLGSWLLAERAGNRLPGPLAAALAQTAAAEYARLAAAPPDALVEQLRRTVRQQPAASHTLATLATQAGLSKYHFARQYKARTGQSPMAEVRAMRLAHARDLLLTTRLPLKAIAEQAGLGDAASLCRLCRQHYEQTPGQLRGRHGISGRMSDS